MGVSMSLDDCCADRNKDGSKTAPGSSQFLAKRSSEGSPHLQEC